MAERWKPNYEEEYFYVDLLCAGPQRVTWTNHDIDKKMWENGNCFKTEPEAEAAAEKVKALLLSLHSEPVTDCNQLPKLTAEVFDRPDCPVWAQYAAVSKFGRLTFFEGKPVLGNNSFLPLGQNHTTKLYRNEPGSWDATDWQNSLIERPAKLPDWCKVGQWVYLCNCTYSRIVSINDCHVNLENGISVGKNSIHEEMVPARLRPYDEEEMRGLVGKVIENGAYCYVVQSYDKNLCAVKMDIGWVYAEYLVKHGYTIDGNPCGILEHLEDGEWVK